jgi:hypothetical protein
MGWMEDEEWVRNNSFGENRYGLETKKQGIILFPGQ